MGLVGFWNRLTKAYRERNIKDKINEKLKAILILAEKPIRDILMDKTNLTLEQAQKATEAIMAKMRDLIDVVW